MVVMNSNQHRIMTKAVGHLSLEIEYELNIKAVRTKEGSHGVTDSGAQDDRSR